MQEGSKVSINMVRHNDRHRSVVPPKPNDVDIGQALTTPPEYVRIANFLNNKADNTRRADDLIASNTKTRHMDGQHVFIKLELFLDVRESKQQTYYGSFRLLQ